jgi:beta-barrel assembly-enhancing protease
MSRLSSWRRPAMALAFAASAGVAAAGCGVTMQQEAQIGAQYAAEINRQIPLVQDAALNRYINDLGRSIARHAERPFQYNFFIVNTDQINAFALPGGYVYINRGLIERTENLSELAGVLAHEIAHVDLRHGAEQLERAQHANLGLTVAYVLMGRAPSGVERAAIDVGGTLWFARHGREAEREADDVAIPLLVRSGIDPRGLTTFFNKLMADQQRQPGRVQQWFSTHPLTTDRIAATQAHIQQLPAHTLAPLTVNSRNYQDFHARLRAQPRVR